MGKKGRGTIGRGKEGRHPRRTFLPTFLLQGPRSKFSSGGAKEECVKENFLGGGGGGGMLVDFYSISLK